jgi:hypothetical protein
MFIFAAGILTGSLCTWYSTKKYYEKIANDEIESMKEWLARRVEEQDEKAEEQSSEPAEKPTSPSMKPNLMEYAAMVKDLGYTDYSRRTEEPEKEAKEDEEVDEMDRPYVIEPEEFGECDYEEVSLTHYADGVLTDEQDNPVEDVDSMVGEDYAEHFGEYEDDSVFVRNDRMQTDFEILADQRNYSDLDKNKSYPTEDE